MNTKGNPQLLLKNDQAW
jgi:arabinan endo-1,5-alpha-L-arabinosidase